MGQVLLVVVATLVILAQCTGPSRLRAARNELLSE